VEQNKSILPSRAADPFGDSVLPEPCLTRAANIVAASLTGSPLLIEGEAYEDNVCEELVERFRTAKFS
jgi:hypothetical protein